MNAKELAAKLNGRETGKEISKVEAAEAKKHGLVVVFGASDDLIEFQGAIDEEVGAYDGTEAILTKLGVLVSECGDGEDCPYFQAIEQRHVEAGNVVEAVWDDGSGPAWTFKTSIPHETFEIMEEGSVWCVGIVFSIDDVKDV